MTGKLVEFIYLVDHFHFYLSFFLFVFFLSIKTINNRSEISHSTITLLQFFTFHFVSFLFTKDKSRKNHINKIEWMTKSNNSKTQKEGKLYKSGGKKFIRNDEREKGNV